MSDIAKNDLYINNLKELIKNRKQLLIHKFKEINKNTSQNEKLQDVLSENIQDYEDIIREKNKLIKSFNNIIKHLDTIIEDKSIPKEQRQEANREKNEIRNIIKLQKYK